MSGIYRELGICDRKEYLLSNGPLLSIYTKRTEGGPCAFIKYKSNTHCVLFSTRQQLFGIQYRKALPNIPISIGVDGYLHLRRLFPGISLFCLWNGFLGGHYFDSSLEVNPLWGHFRVSAMFPGLLKDTAGLLCYSINRFSLESCVEGGLNFVRDSQSISLSVVDDGSFGVSMSMADCYQHKSTELDIKGMCELRNSRWAIRFAIESRG